MAERFHRGWHAASEHGPCDVLPVFGDYLGCVVEPGVDRVIFAFAPDSVRPGLRMSGIGVALTIVAMLLVGYRRA